MTQPVEQPAAGPPGLSDDERETFGRLWRALIKARPGLQRLDRYYEGTRVLDRIGLAVPPELSRFVTMVNWPRIAADSVEQRCDVEGFRLTGADEADDDLWEIWQANDLDEVSQLAHLDSIALGRSYLCVGTRSEDDPLPNVPLITAEAPTDMIHEIDPRTREVKAVLRRVSPSEATLYLPNETIWLDGNTRRGWDEVDRDEHNLGIVPVVPLLNRPRLNNRMGVSELSDVISLTDAACRALTDAQIATEVLAVPQRYVIGASNSDFVDEEGKPLTAWETYFGAVWALPNDEGKSSVGQFAAADLKNFETMVNHYAALVSSQSSVPARYFGLTTTNPPSEGSIISDEVRLIMNARRKHRTLGGGWERAMRIARRLIDGDWNPDLARMETLWANPETPTMAQRADAVVKLTQANILPTEAAWEELGYSATRRKNLRRMLDEQLANDPLKAAADAFRTPPTDPAQVPASDVPAFDPTVGGLRA